MMGSAEEGDKEGDVGNTVEGYWVAVGSRCFELNGLWGRKVFLDARRMVSPGHLYD